MSVLAPSGRFRDPRVTERRRRRLPRLTGGLGFLSREVPSELGGGGTSGSYTRIEHQFRRLSSLLLFLGFPLTSCTNFGNISSSVSASK